VLCGCGHNKRNHNVCEQYFKIVLIHFLKITMGRQKFENSKKIMKWVTTFAKFQQSKFHAN
jgi:hypothetical protein